MRRVHYEQIDSTNSQARRLVLAGERSPVMITATTQSAGRGRDSRAWQSPRGGVWASAIWPVTLPVENCQAFPLVVGLATWHAIHEVVNRYASLNTARLRIKWPNDILLDGRKVAGILCETVAVGSAVTHLIAGVGINVAFPSAKLARPLRCPPISLRDCFMCDHKWVEAISESLGEQLERLLGDFDADGFDLAMMRAVAERLAYVGQVRTWQFGDEQRTGIVKGIDARGRLLIDVEGSELALDCGELVAAESVRN